MAANDDLHAFVRDALTRGEGRAEVEAVLVRAGWGPTRARAALGEFADIGFPVPVPRPRPYLDARDAFLYLVLFGTLYVSLFNLGVLLFEFISRAFPDPAFQDTGVYGAGALAALRAAIAALIVAVPVFLFVSNRVALAIRRDPARRGSKVRRWLSYLTLTIASGILIGDFIAVVTGLLAGELSTRFVLKAAVVAAIAGGVFLYYLWDLKGDEQEVAS